MRRLKKWVCSGLLTITRTIGELGFRKNGSYIDIWIRVNGKETWYSVDRDELKNFFGI